MKAEKPEGPQEPGFQKRKRGERARPKRTGNAGPLGFGSVMRDVRGGDVSAATTGGQPGQPGQPGAPTAAPGAPGFDPALAAAARLDAGAQAALAMGSVPSGEQAVAQDAYGVQGAEEALATQDARTTGAAREAHHPVSLGRMTPSALLSKVVDEATRHAIAEASKELHVELEPAHLGPLVVRLRRERDGRLDVRFLAREGEAARVLEAGSELLRERLAQAGFANAAVAVEHDAELTLGPLYPRGS